MISDSPSLDSGSDVLRPSCTTRPLLSAVFAATSQSSGVAQYGLAGRLHVLIQGHVEGEEEKGQNSVVMYVSRKIMLPEQE